MTPCISLIFCARSGKLPHDLIQNIEQTIGCSYELVVIDNSSNSYSINQAYNIGYENSRSDNLAFLHDDIHFHSNHWGPKLIQHLQVEGAGICGIGGRETLTRVPTSWKVSLANIHLIQSDKKGTIQKIKHRPIGYNEARKPVVMLDGVVLCMRREVIGTIKLDTALEGFHAYDFDLCIRASAAGFQNYVMYDIDIEHFSRGSLDKTYYNNLIKVFIKNTELLPLTTEKMEEVALRTLESEGIYRLARKLTLKGIKLDQIIVYCTTFIDIIGENKKRMIQFIKVQYWLICIFYRPTLLIYSINRLN
jgi:glycosyltransferase involved in cell wall biosynthesis